MKDIMKVTKSLENRGSLLKGTTRKVTSQEVGSPNFLRPLMKSGLRLIKSGLTPLGKNVLLPFGWSTGISAADAAIQKKIYGSGSTASIISNEEMEDIMKIVKSFEESGLLIKGISAANKNEIKKRKGGFLTILLGALAVGMFGSALRGRGVRKAGEDTNRASENF